MPISCRGFACLCRNCQKDGKNIFISVLPRFRGDIFGGNPNALYYTLAREKNQEFFKNF
nr:MAG TPA: hypothetical protein [Caudoviricetes sp.]